MTEEYKSFADEVCILIIILCVIWIGLAIFCAILFWKHFKQKRKDREDFLICMSTLRTKQQEMQLIEQNSVHYIENLKEIKGNDIKDLEACISSIKISDEIIKLSQKEEYLLNTDIVLHFHTIAKSNGLPLPKDWKALNELIQECIPSFFPIICRNKELREDEKRLCILVRLHFLPSEISSLLCISKQAVTTNRKRLLYKIFGINNLGAKEFDRRIMLIT